MLCRLAWCLPCGFQHVVPYFYAVYFAVLLGALMCAEGGWHLLLMCVAPCHQCLGCLSTWW